MQLVKTALLAGLAIVLAGCSQNVGFKPLQNATKVGMLDLARYTIAVDAHHSAVITLVGRGVARPDPEVRYDAVAIRVTVDNGSAIPVDVTSAKLVLPTGWALAAADVIRSENAQIYGYVGSGKPPSAAPGDAVNSSEFIFHLPLEANLNTLNSFKLVWTAGVAGRTETFTTDFVKTPEPLRTSESDTYWQNADTMDAKYTGVWYGIIGPPFGND